MKEQRARASIFQLLRGRSVFGTHIPDDASQLDGAALVHVILAAADDRSGRHDDADVVVINDDARSSRNLRDRNEYFIVLLPYSQ